MIYLVKCYRSPPADAETDPQVFVNRQRRKQASTFRHKRDAGRADRRRRYAGETLAAVFDYAFDPIDLADDCFEKSRFAGAVGADQRHDLTGVDAQVNFAHSLKLIVVDA